MRFDFGDYTDEPVEIDLGIFEGADAIVALSGSRYVDYAAKPAVGIEAVRADGTPEPGRNAVVRYSGCGEDEDFESIEDDGEFRVLVVDFAVFLPEEMRGSGGVMAALDAVSAEVL